MTAAPPARRKHWGWGLESAEPPAEERRAAAAGLRDHLGFGDGEVEQPVPLAQARLPAVGLEAPAALREICSTDDHDRASHALGKSYRDVVRGFRGDFTTAPDVVARPRSEGEVEAVLAWCEEAGAVCIPYGGGTSVVGGVEPPAGVPAVSLDLGALAGLIEVDHESRAARLGAGTPGPAVEAALREHGLTLRFYPQSFELSTVGGWVATRAAGHFATGETHIDDLVESVRAITPRGAWESRRLPGSGAGPSPDRLLLGSEGTLGVITEAWLRVRPRPTHRASAGVRFRDFASGAAAARDIVQSGMRPANCRLLDPEEAAVTGAAADAALLVLGFESHDEPVGDGLARAIELCASHGGQTDGEPRVTGPGDTASKGSGEGAWRRAFLGAPYLRDTMVAAGILTETFETAMTWERLPAFVEDTLARVREAVAQTFGAGRVSVRLTHVYPDGAAPYFTVLAPVRRGSELEQWAQVKAIAGEAVVAAGATITHHHAVGRDHRPWYDRQRPDPFARGLAAIKSELDPAGILNPGVLIDPAVPAS